MFLDFKSGHLGMGMGWWGGGSQEGAKQRALPDVFRSLGMVTEGEDRP